MPSELVGILRGKEALQTEGTEDDRCTWQSTASAAPTLHDEVGNTYGATVVGGSATAHFGNVYNNYHGEQKQTVIDILKKSLTFPRMNARLLNVANASPATCEWLFKNESFISWVDDYSFIQHHGFFWIKGKPGSGKSTIMKRTLAWAKDKWPDRAQISYFFNARALDPLEKSTLGLYRSLVHQILSANHHLEDAFGDTFQFKVGGTPRISDTWTEAELQNFLIENVALCKPLTMFIDALDEGYDQEVRAMIAYFENLSYHAAARKKPLRICLSSRHYPQILIRQGLSIIVEDQDGHSGDLSTYIRATLPPIESDEMDSLRQTVLHRSKGIFLWIVVVLPILTKIYLQGRGVSAMMQKLQAVPQDIYDLFASILSRDLDGIEECFTLLRWIIYAQESLEVEEVYTAVRQKHSRHDLHENGTANLDDMKRYLLNCSRGLVEIVNHGQQDGDGHVWFEEGMEGVEGKDKDLASVAAVWSRYSKESKNTVQLIHLSVRDFLVQKYELSQSVLDGSSNLPTGSAFHRKSCHAEIATVCLEHMLQVFESGLSDREEGQPLRLAGYSSIYWWQHMQRGSEACSDTSLQLACTLLKGEGDNIRKWALLLKRRVGREFQSSKGVHPSSKNLGVEGFIKRKDIGNGLYFSARMNLVHVLNQLLLFETNIDVKGGKFGTALQAATYFGHEEIVQSLLTAKANPDVYSPIYGTALDIAVFRHHETIVRMLVKGGAQVNTKGGFNGTALSVALREGQMNMIQLLIDAGATLSEEQEIRMAQLVGGHSTKRHLHDEIDILTDNVVSIDFLDFDDNTRLMRACTNMNRIFVQDSLESGSDVTVANSRHQTALHIAAQKLSYYSEDDSKEVLELVRTHGMEHLFDTLDVSSLSPLLQSRHQEIIRLLLDYRPKSNFIANRAYLSSGLCGAARNKQPSLSLVALLLKLGADPDFGINSDIAAQVHPLSVAKFEGKHEMVELLMAAGATPVQDYSPAYTGTSRRTILSQHLESCDPKQALFWPTFAPLSSPHLGKNVRGEDSSGEDSMVE